MPSKQAGKMRSRLSKGVTPTPTPKGQRGPRRVARINDAAAESAPYWLHLQGTNSKARKSKGPSHRDDIKSDSSLRYGLDDQDRQTVTLTAASFSQKGLVKDINDCLKNKQRFKVQLPSKSELPSFDLQSLKRLKQVVDLIGGDSLFPKLVLSRQQAADSYIIDKVVNAASSDDDESLKYLHRVKSARVVSDKSSPCCYHIVMDLDFDTFVSQNASFENEIITELASTIGIHRSLLRLHCSRKGSVIIAAGLVKAGAVLLAGGVPTVLYLAWRNLGESDLDTDNTVRVRWCGKIYYARVTGEDDATQQITIEYLNHPFWFNNVETLPYTSPRLERLDKNMIDV